MSTRDIPKDRWCDELDTFSRQHEGWIVRVDVSGADGTTHTQARDLPLIGVSCDAPQSDRIAIMAGNRVDDHLTHELDCHRRNRRRRRTRSAHPIGGRLGDTRRVPIADAHRRS